MNGFINVNKPAGITSSDVVVRLRRKLIGISGNKKIKVGHMGTLDPAAEGVLVIAVGNAAKLFDYFIEKKKVYTAEFTFGKTTDTLDREGKFTAENGRLPDMDELKAAAKKLAGEVWQIPPAYSAKSVGGVRAYDRARRGEDFEIPAKKVSITDVSIVSFDGERAEVTVECKGGVYIRSIARDLGALCGTAAYMSALKRTRAGAFKIEDAAELDALLNGEINLIPTEFILEEFPKFDADISLFERLNNGARPRIDGMPKGNFVLYCGGKLFGIAEGESGELIVKTRLIGNDG
ncbi:MAG: tRNA pseudouridine(55) synthase TruB [Clostridiales bacterium]|jgi:tRNA pseudouridine55 synthase|nr:tRNA pseudouridine(55) synthase TruB [Clostridiales bacterium]